MQPVTGILVFKMLDVIGAAAVATIMALGFVLEPAPAITAVASRPIRPIVLSNADTNKPVNVPRASGVPKAVCTQSWPYYEQDCLHDGRQPEGKARIVRIVALTSSQTER
jgi:hypothetical protein